MYEPPFVEAGVSGEIGSSIMSDVTRLVKHVFCVAWFKVYRTCFRTGGETDCSGLFRRPIKAVLITNCCCLAVHLATRISNWSGLPTLIDRLRLQVRKGLKELK